MKWNYHDNQTRSFLCIFAKILGAEGEDAWIADRFKEKQAEHASDTTVPWQL